MFHTPATSTFYLCLLYEHQRALHNLLFVSLINYIAERREREGQKCVFICVNFTLLWSNFKIVSFVFWRSFLTSCRWLWWWWYSIDVLILCCFKFHLSSIIGATASAFCKLFWQKMRKLWWWMHQIKYGKSLPLVDKPGRCSWFLAVG